MIQITGFGSPLLSHWRHRHVFEPDIHDCMVLSGMHVRRLNRLRGRRIRRWGSGATTAGERVRDRLAWQRHKAAERHAWWRRRAKR